MHDDPEPIRDAAHRAYRLAERAAAGHLPATPRPQPAEPWATVDRAAQWPAQVPARFAAATIDQLDGDLRTLADQWTAGGMTSNVLLLGGTGVGKSHAAYAMAREAFVAGSDVLVRPVIRLLRELRPEGAPGMLDRALHVDVLVLDDLGSEKPSDWTEQTLQEIVDDRWGNQRPTIVTSNLAPTVLRDRVGERMWSRLYHDAFRLEIGGQDRRLTA